MAKKEKTLGDFKKDIEEKLKSSKDVPGSETFIKQYKCALLRTMFADPAYQKAKKEYRDAKKLQNLKDIYIRLLDINPTLTWEDFLKFERGDTESDSV